MACCPGGSQLAGLAKRPATGNAQRRGRRGERHCEVLAGKVVKVSSLAWSGAEVEIFVMPISFKRHRFPVEVIQQASVAVFQAHAQFS